MDEATGDSLLRQLQVAEEEGSSVLFPVFQTAITTYLALQGTA